MTYLRLLSTLNINKANSSSGRNSASGGGYKFARYKSGRYKTRAFTLLEFTVVLIIITILIALLVSKIDFLQDDAYKKPNLQLTAKSLQSAVNMSRHLWLSKGPSEWVRSSDGSSLLQGFGEDNVLMSKTGWPVDAINKDQLDSLISTGFALNNSTCTRLWSGLLKDTTAKVETLTDTMNTSASPGVFTYHAELHQGVCIYRYLLNDKGWRIEYDLRSGQIETLFE